jgi:hypothetical protein
MVDRRQFLAGAAAAVAGTVGGGVFIDRRDEGTPLPLHAAVIDTRFSEAKPFGREMQRRGVSLRRIRGDVTDLWYHELHPRWKEGAAVVAGLTAYGALFCLERLAWDHGMRVLYLGEHRAVSAERFEHLLAGPAYARIARPATFADPERWPAQVASHIARWEKPSASAAAEARAHCAGARIAISDQHLYSWVIAPCAHA